MMGSMCASRSGWHSRRLRPTRTILAIPWYGRAWSTRSDESGARTRGGERFLDPSTRSTASRSPWAATAGRRWNAKQDTAWPSIARRACATCPVSYRQLWYDDVDSVSAKVGLARRKGLRGIGIWALGYDGDQPELWSALRYGFEKTTDREPPTGEAAIDAAGILGHRGGVPSVGETITLELRGVPMGTMAAASRSYVSRPAGGATAMVRSRAGRPSIRPFGGHLAPRRHRRGRGLCARRGGRGEPFPFGIAGPRSTVAARQVPVSIRIQWRDIAGNWSNPVRVDVVYQPTASPRTAEG